MGGSSGSILAGCFKYLKENGLHEDANIRCVVIFPDTIRNYISKIGNESWMIGNGFS